MSVAPPAAEPATTKEPKPGNGDEDEAKSQFLALNSALNDINMRLERIINLLTQQYAASGMNQSQRVRNLKREPF